MKLRLIITAFVSIVLLCGLVYAETQTILVSSNETCSNYCETNRTICEKMCTSKPNSMTKYCLRNCMKSYDKCMNWRCHRKGDWDRVRTGQ